MGTRAGATSATGELARQIAAAERVVALTGAGVSVPSGIPDFRSPGTGLWERVDPMEVAHIDAFRRDPKRFWGFYAQRFDSLAHKQPNAAHRALAAMESAGLLQAVVTQNVDELHRKAGTRELVEVHGSIAGCVCLHCGASVSREQARSRIAADPDGVPRCEACDAPLKPRVVLFGEMLPEEALLRAQQLCGRADVLLCIGSSLEVYPVAALPELTLAAGGKVAIITRGTTPFDDLAGVRLDGDVVAEMQGLLEALGLAG